ncbi:MAG: DUF1122 family protein [Sulfolobales archaeon]|nr:DUF1122 family protein [Sulfolobales archaeon]MCX8186829.1 DUF1122 family protein [Sulfolobales archaeon]MDW7969827.1 DUF1122 family protein [Sulfolobales archaeon]
MKVLCAEIFNDLEGFSYGFSVRRGRFPEEENIEIHIGYGDLSRRLMIIKVFSGRLPHYRKWVEVFSINSAVMLGEKSFTFLNSVYEDRLIRCISEFLGPGEKVFIEYTYDEDTRRAVEVGIPPHLTRLGYKLFQHGFTWFKDWYFPEGFMEGGPKLQAEKPISDDVRTKHIRDLCLQSFSSVNLLESLGRSSSLYKLMQGVIKTYQEFTGRYCRD